MFAIPRPNDLPESPQPSSFQPLPVRDRPIERLRSYNFHSAILPDDRTVSVYLPPQYESEPNRRFATFYMHDGQNLFDPETSYVAGHTWRAGTTADLVNKNGEAAPIILVGIANTGLRRMPEYTPTRDYRLGGGEGHAYGRLLVEEVKPWVDVTFRSLPDRLRTGLGGSSLGGLITLYLGLRYPEVFGRLAVMSPSIWWDHRTILGFVAAAHPKPDLRIWLDVGTAEGTRHIRDAEMLSRRLIQKGWKLGVDLQMTKVTNAAHTEDAWADRLHEVLKFLFPPEQPH